MIEENLEENRSDNGRNIHLVSATLGFLALANTAAMGFYLLSVMFNPIFVSILGIQGYILFPIMVMVEAMFSYGSILILKGEKVRKGAGINLVLGLFLAAVYLYYAYFSKPLLLNWISPAGIVLVIPALLSGITGKLMLTK